MIAPFYSRLALQTHLAAIEAQARMPPLPTWPPNEIVKRMTTRQFRHYLADLEAQDKCKLMEYRRKLGGIT